MKLIPVLGVCTILIVIPAAANQRHKDYTTYKGGVEDYDRVDRTKQSVTALIRAILNTARLIYSSVDYRVYVKVGGYKDALRDFKSLQPNGVGKFKNSVWGNVGDRKVVVSTDPVQGIQVLNIWKVEEKSGGSTKAVADIIVYRSSNN